MNTQPPQTSKGATAQPFQIRYLKPDEIENPYLVIERLFANTHLPALREALWQWLRITITGTYSLEESLQQANLIHLYEEMERVLEAMWVMREN
ncbi:MAG: hypothetical protein NTW29_08340 [Bacteroidetes bacterium]|nr:hypothetical protein [Bacteroidota bacterium]